MKFIFKMITRLISSLLYFRGSRMGNFLWAFLSPWAIYATIPPYPWDQWILSLGKEPQLAYVIWTWLAYGQRSIFRVPQCGDAVGAAVSLPFEIA